MFHHESSSRFFFRSFRIQNIGTIQLGNITWKHIWKHNLETFELFRNFATINVKKVMMYRGESESLTLIILDQPTNHLPRSNKTDIERTYHFCVKSSWYQFQSEMGGLSAAMDEAKTSTRTRTEKKFGQTWKCMYNVYWSTN